MFVFLAEASARVERCQEWSMRQVGSQIALEVALWGGANVRPRGNKVVKLLLVGDPRSESPLTVT